jgi:F-type H+-transporting ATPase subunit b
MIGLVTPEWMEWFNYPGLEIWKFINLAIFTALGIYLLRSPISAALGTRREAIQQELIRAQEQKEQALAKLAEADSLLSRVDADVNAVREEARKEAESERQRQAAATAREIEKLKQQSQREIDTAGKLARNELRRFFAKTSIELARQSVRSRIRPEDDAQLIQQSIGELRRTRV